MATSLPVVTIEAFEGPFDLVLELVRTGKMSLDAISLGKLTQSFLEQWQRQAISPELQAHFVRVASILLLMKIRRLLPSLEREEEEEVENLEKRLEVYAIFRHEALRLRREWGRQRMFNRADDPLQPEIPRPPAPVVLAQGADGLAQICQAVFNSFQKPHLPLFITPVRRYSLPQAWGELKKRLRRQPRIVLQQVIAEEGPHAAASLFLSVLEMARRQEVELTQEQAFGSIHITRERE